MTPEQRKYVIGVHADAARKLDSGLRSLRATARRGTDMRGADLSAEDFQEIQFAIDRERFQRDAHKAAIKALRGAQ